MTELTHRLISRETSGYDQERAGFQARAAHRPELIVAATSAADIRAAVELATGRGLPVAVQASGHGLTTSMTGGLLISTRRMSEVRVDPRNRTGWVAAGATWRRVLDAAAPHGLAPLSGSSPGVGAVSYTLGGGVGLLARRYGFAADHVRRIDLVTADGRPRTVTAADEPDLFWALRGGGGNFGVVTGMEIDLMPVASIFGGGLYFDLERVPGVLAAWREWTATVPAELTSAVALIPLPGKHVAQLQIAFAGPATEGKRLVEPLRAVGPILKDTLRELPYVESGAVFDEPDTPHAYLSANVLLDELPSDALATIGNQCVVGLRHLGGALARPPAIGNAVGHRDAAYSLSVLSLVDGVDVDAVRARHRAMLEPWAAHVTGRSLNFTFDQLTSDQVRDAFAPADYRRLIALKAYYDPHGVFRANHAIG